MLSHRASSTGAVSHGEITSSCMENGTIQGPHSTIRTPINPFMEHAFHHGISSDISNGIPSPVRVASVGNQSGLGEPSHSLGQMKFGFQCMPTFHPHSFLEYYDGLANGIPYNSLGTMAVNISPRPLEGINSRHRCRVGSNGLSNELNESGMYKLIILCSLLSYCVICCLLQCILYCYCPCILLRTCQFILA